MWNAEGKDLDSCKSDSIIQIQKLFLFVLKKTKTARYKENHFINKIMLAVIPRACK